MKARISEVNTFPAQMSGTMSCFILHTGQAAGASSPVPGPGGTQAGERAHWAGELLCPCQEPTATPGYGRGDGACPQPGLPTWAWPGLAWPGRRALGASCRAMCRATPGPNTHLCSWKILLQRILKLSLPIQFRGSLSSVSIRPHNNNQMFQLGPDQELLESSQAALTHRGQMPARNEEQW